MPPRSLSSICIAAFIVLITSSSAFAGQNVKSSPRSTGLPQSPFYKVTVDGLAVPTHEVRINPHPQAAITSRIPAEAQTLATDAPAAMASFDFTGAVTVEITVDRPVSGIVVRPLARRVVPAFDGRVVRFTLDRPGDFVVEFDGVKTLPLFLFANAPERSAPKPDGEGVRYYGPGDHAVGRIDLRSNETLYLAAGALVRGWVVAENAENVRIAGRGVLYGGDYTWADMQKTKQKFITFRSCRGVSVEGITVLDGFGWNFAVYDSREVDFDGVKIIGWRRNTDGIDPVSSQDVRIRNSFIKVQDDGVSIKGNARHGGDTIKNIEISNCVFWVDYMRNIVVGGEMSGIRTMENIVIRDIDILNSSFNPGHDRDAALSIWNADASTIRNVLFENIRVENCHRLVRIGIVKNQHSTDEKRGRIEGITFRNVESLGGPSIVEISGYSQESDVADIRFENVTIMGRPLAERAGLFILMNQYVTGVTFSGSGSGGK